MTEYQNEQVVNETAPAADAFATAYEAPAAPEKKSNKMLPVIIIAAIAVVAIILGILLLGAGGGKFITRDQGFVKGPEGNIYLNGKKVAQLDYESVYLYNAYDGKSALAECMGEGDSGYTLFVVTKKGATEIASDIDVVAYSQNRDFVVYRDNTDNGENLTYTWYNVAKKKSETLGEDLASVKLSPDGKTVAYAEVEEKDDGMEYTTYYGHCSKLLVGVGDKVHKGQHIAEMGSTGRSTGNHCHFEVRIRGSSVNPLNYLP